MVLSRAYKLGLRQNVMGYVVSVDLGGLGGGGLGGAGGGEGGGGLHAQSLITHGAQQPVVEASSR